jgi:hypothetical protein
MKKNINSRTVYRSLFSLAILIGIGAAVATFAGTDEEKPLDVGPNPRPHIEILPDQNKDYLDPSTEYRNLYITDEDEILPHYEFEDDYNDDKFQPK